MLNDAQSSSPGAAGNGWNPPQPSELQPEFPGYELVDLIGLGGMGAVYRARQREPERMVAIKVMPASAAEDEEAVLAREQFANEALALRRLHHPNIIAGHDFGTTPGGMAYLCMEYFHGFTLYEMIAKNTRLPGVRVLGLLMPVCDALDYAHAEGVIHRDVKPENILIDTDGHVRVADFGLARLEEVHGRKRRELMMGTPDYVAPEVYNREAMIDGRADVFSLGVMLHHMLTGAPLRAERVPASKLVGCDPRFDVIILKATERDPARRYATAGEMKEALGRLAASMRTPVAVGARAQKAAEGKGPAAPKGEGRAAVKPLKPGGKEELRAAPVRGGARGWLYAGGGLAAALAAAGIYIATREEQPADDGKPQGVMAGPAKEETPPPGRKEEKPPVPRKPEPKVAVDDLRPEFGIPARAGEVVTGSGGRYQFLPGSLTWAEANKKAVEAGGMLACFATREELVFVAEKVVMPAAGESRQAGSVWVGAQLERAGEWKWLNGEAIAEKLWQDGQPNVGKREGSGSLPAAVVLDKRDGVWGLNDLADDAEVQRHWRRSCIGYVVEWPLAEPVVARPGEMTPAPEAVTPVPVVAAGPGAEARKALAAAEVNFRAALEREALGAWTKATAELEAMYAAGIDRAVAAAAQSGKQEEAVIFEQEKRRLTAKEELPAADDPALPAALKAMRKTLRDKLAKLNQEKERKVKPLYDKYLVWVAGRVADYTKQKKPDDARAAQEYRDRIAAESAPVSTATAAVPGAKDPALIKPFRRPEPVPLPPELAEAAPAPMNSRKLAEWALSGKQGRVVIEVNGKRKELKEESAPVLPEGDWKLLELDAGDPPKSGFEPAWLSGEALTKLDLSGLGVGNPLNLRASTGLKLLRFAGTDMKPEEMRFFPVLPELKVLSLTGGSLSALDVQVIAERTAAVESLELHGLGSAGCVEMGLLWPKLSGLLLSKIQCSAEDARALPAMAALGSLSLKNTTFDFKVLKDCAALNRVTLEGKSYGDAEVKLILGLPQVKVLKLREVELTGGALAGLEGRQGLTSLVFDHCAFDGKGLELLASQQGMELLGLDYTDIDDAAMLALPALPVLKELQLPHCSRIGDDAVPGITRQTALTRLDLSSCKGLTSAGLVSILDGLPRLESLDASTTAVDAAVLDAIVRHPALRSVDLKHTKLDPAAAIPVLAASKSLTWLAVPSSFSSDDVQALKSARNGLTVTR